MALFKELMMTEQVLQAKLRPNRNCGCTVEQAFFLILLWSCYARAYR
jgi:hypothetical protein